MKIKVSVGNSRMDKRWNQVEMELDEFRDRIAATNRTAETVEQYRSFQAKQDDIKDVGGFVLGVLKNGRRKGQRYFPLCPLPGYGLRKRASSTRSRCSSPSAVGSTDAFTPRKAPFPSNRALRCFIDDIWRSAEGRRKSVSSSLTTPRERFLCTGLPAL